MSSVPFGKLELSARATRARAPRAGGLLALLLAGALALAAPAAAEPGWERRIVAVGDIHGAYDELFAILRRTALVDQAGRWTGGDAILVQTGDYLDRGAESIRVLDLLMQLEREAPEQGGEVHVLLGNHEIFNLIGELKDVTPDILAGFVDGDSERRRIELCRQWAAIEERRAEAGDEGAAARAFSGCLQRNPTGMVEYLEAMGPKGHYGRWLRRRPVAVRLGEGIFLHGGISQDFRRWSLDEINRRAAREIAVLDAAREWLRSAGQLPPASNFQELLDALPQKVRRPPGTLTAQDLRRPLRPVFPRDLDMFVDVRQWLIVRDDGPLWFRGYALWDEAKGEARLPGILEALGARYLVVGHTPQRQRAIRARFDGQVYLIDTGMLGSVYEGGRAAALEIVDGEVSALYVEESRQLLGRLEGAAPTADRSDLASRP